MSAACAKPGCAAVPTMREDIRGTLGIFGPQGIERTYVLCERHDRDYFGEHKHPNDGWLTAEKSQRIKRDLIPLVLSPTTGAL